MAAPLNAKFIEKVFFLKYKFCLNILNTPFPFTIFWLKIHNAKIFFGEFVEIDWLCNSISCKIKKKIVFKKKL